LPTPLPKKVEEQIAKARLPRSGAFSFEPKLTTNRRGQQVIEKADVIFGPKKGKKGYLDVQGRIWIKDRANSGLPDHGDVQVDEGNHYLRVDLSGNELT
jgi:hypothetical protein